MKEENQPSIEYEKCPICTSNNLRNTSKNKSQCFTCKNKFEFKLNKKYGTK